MKITKQGAVITAIIALVTSANAQLQFTHVKATPDGAIQLRWQSESNATYRIEYTPQLSDSITWNVLYEDVASQGTNTLWADAGGLLSQPLAMHPSDDPARFYRVVQSDTFDPASAPQIQITSPTNGATLTGDVTVTVSVTSAIDLDNIRLYVDGAEVGYNIAEATNFVLNTCQFANGAHQIFAVAANCSGGEMTGETSSLQENYGTSSSVAATFNNLITAYRGKIRFQDPNNGDTNRFTAAFASYADWTLTITNQSGAAVRTVTGTSYNMEFIWDGTDDQGATVADGGYSAVLSASQSSSSPPNQMSSPFSQAMTTAVAAGATTYFMEPPPMPPVRVQTNGVWAWVPWEEVYGPQPLIEVPIPRQFLGTSAPLLSRPVPSSPGPMDGPQPDPPSSQTTVLQPMPFVWFGNTGSIGIAYQGNHPDGVTFGPNTRPANGIPLQRVSLIGSPGSYGTRRSCWRIALGFNRYLGDAGYHCNFFLRDYGLVASDLRKPSKGGRSVFNNVNLGLLMGHGTYGTSPDWTISGSGPLQSYYPVYTGANGYDWVRLSEFSFGSSKLRWMSVLTCNNLVDSVYQDCYNKEVLPVNGQLHLLCGAKSYIFLVSNFGSQYSAALTGSAGVARKSIVDSWFYAGTKTQGIQPGGAHMSVDFRVIGWPNCFGDDLVNYQSPNSGNPADITFQDAQVFTYP